MRVQCLLTGYFPVQSTGDCMMYAISLISLSKWLTSQMVASIAVVGDAVVKTVGESSKVVEFVLNGLDVNVATEDDE